MTPTDFLHTNLDPGLAWAAAVPGWTIPSDDRARLVLTAISGTESGWTERVQSGNGPAHSLYQMERAGGVTDVLHHPASSSMAHAACAAVPVIADSVHVWGLFATERGDNLATAFARLLLWTDPAPLPAIGAEGDALHCYLRLWRPGKPDPARFLERYREAREAMGV